MPAGCFLAAGLLQFRDLSVCVGLGTAGFTTTIVQHHINEADHLFRKGALRFHGGVGSAQSLGCPPLQGWHFVFFSGARSCRFRAAALGSRGTSLVQAKIAPCATPARGVNQLPPPVPGENVVGPVQVPGRQCVGEDAGYTRGGAAPFATPGYRQLRRCVAEVFGGGERRWTSPEMPSLAKEWGSPGGGSRSRLGWRCGPRARSCQNVLGGHP